MRIKGKNAKNDIKEAAITLFKEKGFENVMISDICERAGCTPSTFYYHFKSMDGFRMSLWDVDSRFTMDVLVSILSLPSAWEKLWAVHSRYVQEALSYGPVLYSYMTTPASTQGRDVMLENMGKINDLIAPFVKEGQESGEIRNSTATEDLVHTVGQTMSGVLREWSLREGNYDVEREMRRSLEVLYDLRTDLRQASTVKNRKNQAAPDVDNPGDNQATVL